MPSRPLPPGRIGLEQFLFDAGIARGTFFTRYRHAPDYILSLDIEEDRDRRLHFPVDAGHRLRAHRGKAPHGNAGRTRTRPCPSCGHALHPRHTACGECWHVLVPNSPRQQSGSAADVDARPARRSTAQVNFERRDRLRRAKEEARRALSQRESFTASDA